MAQLMVFFASVCPCALRAKMWYRSITYTISKAQTMFLHINTVITSALSRLV